MRLSLLALAKGSKMDKKDDPYDMASKSLDELLRIITGRNPDTLDHQYAKIELEKRKMASKQNTTPNEATDISDGVHNPNTRSGITLKLFALGVGIAVFAAIIIDDGRAIQAINGICDTAESATGTYATR